MRFIEDLCPPALLYAIFLAIQLGFSAVSWFMVAAPFIITSLATAIAIGTDFDRVVIGQISKEGFISKDDKMELVPADSNQVK